MTGVQTCALPICLGLAIVRQAVLRMGGQVQIGVGVNGKGVGFFVSIPLPHSA